MGFVDVIYNWMTIWLINYYHWHEVSVLRCSIAKKNSYLEQNIDELSDKVSSAEKEIEELKKLLYKQSNSPSDTEPKHTMDMSPYEYAFDFPKTYSTICKQCGEKKEKITVLEIENDLKNQENEELRLQISELQKKLRRVEVELEDFKCLPQQNNKVWYSYKFYTIFV